MSHADDIESAMSDAEDLTKWAEPNTVVYNDALVERAVLGALLGQPVPSELAAGQPLLWLVSGDVDLPVHLMHGLVEFMAIAGRATCGRCGARRSSRHRLLVPASASVVCLFVCGLCRDYLDEDYTDLVWEETA